MRSYVWRWQEAYPLVVFMQDTYRLLLLADAALNATSESVEKGSIQAIREWYTALGKAYYTIGPPNPLYVESSNTVPVTPSPDDAKVLFFLDRVHKTHGDRSIIYVL
jgi:hypothetical protein